MVPWLPEADSLACLGVDMFDGLAPFLARRDAWAYLAACLTAIAISVPVARYVRDLALARGLVDPVGGRKQHKTPVPRLGGCGIFAGFAVGSAVGLWLLGPDILARSTVWPTMWPLLVGASVMFITGLADDLLHRQGREGLPALLKLVLQVGAACVVAGVARVQGLALPGGVYVDFPVWLEWGLTVFWVVFVTNAINWIDGMDGLAGGLSLIFALCLGLVGMSRAPGVGTFGEPVLALALVGGLVGFLRLNFPPATMFMGDGGALFLGYVLAATSVSGLMKGAALIGIATPMMVMALPMIDSVKVVFGRAVRRERLMAADRTHLQFRLTDAGWEVHSSLLFAYALAGLSGCAAMALLRLRGGGASLAILVSVLLVWVAARRPKPCPPAEPVSAAVDDSATE